VTGLAGVDLVTHQTFRIDDVAARIVTVELAV
jgi:hypothetical protein